MIEFLGFMATVGINRVVEVLSQILQQTPIPDNVRAIILLVASQVVGVGLAFTVQADMLYIGTPVEALGPVALNLITGLALGGGANGWNWILNYLGKYAPEKVPALPSSSPRGVG